MAFCSGSLLTVLILDLSAGSVVLSEKPLSNCIPKASERMDKPAWKMYLKISLHGRYLWSGEAQMGCTLLVKRRDPLSFSWEEREKQVIGFETGSAWCGCIRFCFSDWKCQDFFSFFKKVKADISEYRGMPERQGQSFLLGSGRSAIWKASVPGRRPDDPGRNL